MNIPRAYSYPMFPTNLPAISFLDPTVGPQGYGQ